VGEQSPRSEWTLLYLLIDPTTGPTNHSQGTVFYVGWAQDTVGLPGAARELLDLGAPEAVPATAPVAVVERVKALWAAGLAPVVRIMTFGGPGQLEDLDGARLAQGWAASLSPRPWSVGRDLPPPKRVVDAESRQLLRHADLTREWAVEDYVTLRDPRPVVLPTEAPVLVAALDLNHHSWSDVAPPGIEMSRRPPVRWWDLERQRRTTALWRWVTSLKEDPLLVLVVRRRSAAEELFPVGLVVGVWSGRVRPDWPRYSSVAVDPEPTGPHLTGLRHALLRGRLTEVDGTPFRFDYALTNVVGRPRPITGAGEPLR